MNTSIEQIFGEEYRNLRPRAPMPTIEVVFRPFTSLNTTIRLRQGKIYVHLSDMLEGAPKQVLRAIAHILLAKLYRKAIDPAEAARYRRFTNSEPVMHLAELIRQSRGHKRIAGPDGEHYHLEEIFDDLNTRFFHGLLGRPQLSWSGKAARHSLGHYDSAHNTIVVSRVFDRRNTPRYAIEYLLYHEMLHLKHPVRVRRGKRCVHSREFQAEERLFPQLALARQYLKSL